MNIHPATIIFRHRKENIKKCSLRGLEKREEPLFYRYPVDAIPDLSGYVMLSMKADTELSEKDKDCGLLLLDATWRYAERMERFFDERVEVPKRGLPNLATAYPRKQTGCEDPSRGLASIEALFIAYHILGRDTSALLDHYPFKHPFLSLLQRSGFATLSSDV